MCAPINTRTLCSTCLFFHAQGNCGELHVLIAGIRMCLLRPPQQCPVHRPPDYAELVLHTPLLFEQQTLIHCEQGDEEICRLCKEAAWAGQGDVQGSDSRDDDDFEDVIDRCVCTSCSVAVGQSISCDVL